MRKLVVALGMVCASCTSLVDLDGLSGRQQNDGAGGGGLASSTGPGGAGGGGGGSSAVSAGGGNIADVTLTFGERPSSDIEGVTADAELNAADLSSMLGGAQTMWLNGSPSDRRRAVIRFDISAVPSTAMVLGAELSLFTLSAPTAESNSPLSFFALIEGWDEGGVSWLERGGGFMWTTAGAGSGSRDGQLLGTMVPLQLATEYAITIPPRVVQDWVDDPSSNFGMVIDCDGMDAAGFSSHEHADPGRRPLLAVTFRP